MYSPKAAIPFWESYFLGTFLGQVGQVGRSNGAPCRVLMGCR